MLAPPRPAPWKNGLPREKQALPRSAPQKLTRPAGRNGEKLTEDNTDYAHCVGPTHLGLGKPSYEEIRNQKNGQKKGDNVRFG